MVEVQIGVSGRIVIPAEFRHQLGLMPGDRIVARVEQDQLIFEKAETIKRRLKQRYAHLKGQKVVEDLITERRIAARQE